MKYDLIIRNGRIIDGSGIPGFHGDVAISAGKIMEVGHVSGDAAQVLDAKGMVIAPGFVDNHTHYDAQVIWDPLCTYSCYHGVTTVVTGNCSLGLAPAHAHDRDMLTSVLSHVEAIPLEAIRELLDLSAHPARPCAEADAIAARQLRAVERKIARLQALQSELSRMVAECHGGAASRCRVLEVLKDHSECLTEHVQAEGVAERA